MEVRANPKTADTMEDSKKIMAKRIMLSDFEVDNSEIMPENSSLRKQSYAFSL